MSATEIRLSKALRLGPEINDFNDTNQATTEAARDAYFSSNPSNLAVYDSNSSLMIRLTYLDDDTLVTKFQVRMGGAWVDYTPVVQGPPGEVASLAGVQIGEIPYKLVDGTFGGSNMRILGDGSILAPPGFGVESGSISFGDVLTVSEASGFLAINNHLDDKQYTLLDYQTPRDAASLRPNQFKLINPEFSFVAQAVETTNLADEPLVFPYTVQNTARTNSLTFRTYAAMTNVRLKVSQVSNGIALKYFPNKQAWEEGFGGVSWGIGDNTTDFGNTPVILSAGVQLQFEIRADIVALKGNVSGVPYFSGMIQQGIYNSVVTDQEYTASDVKSKLESLSSPNKLAKTAIQDGVLSVNSAFGDVVIDKAGVGLGNVDNTSDVNKPVSTAQQTAINLSITNHNAAVDPHPQYTTTAEASAAAPVQSVNSLIGDVELTTDNVPEGSILYYSDGRVQNYLTASGYLVKTVVGGGSGASVYNANTLGEVSLRNINGTGNITVTQNANDITISAPNVTSGVYTPTLFNTTNITTSSASQCQYMRVGSVVTVSGVVTIDPSSNNQITILGITLPIASNIGANEDCAGTAVTPDVSGQAAGILGDATNNRALLEFVAGSTSSHPMSFTFTYRII